MATLTRPQLVLKSLQSDGQYATHKTQEVTKTATMTYGTLLKADLTEATATDLASGTYDIGFIIDDASIDEAATGAVVTVSCVSRPEWLIFRGSELKLGSTALTAPQIVLFEAGSNPIEVQ